MRSAGPEGEESESLECSAATLQVLGLRSLTWPLKHLRATLPGWTQVAATTGEGHSPKKGFARQTGHPNRDAPGSGNPLRRTNGFQGSIQLLANHTVVADLLSIASTHQRWRQDEQSLSLQSQEGRKTQAFCNRSDSDVFCPSGLAALPLPPLSSDPCGFANGGKPEAGNR